MSTRPTRFIRFFPSFCFSSSFRLRVTSLDYHLAGYRESRLVKLDLLVNGEPGVIVRRQGALAAVIALGAYNHRIDVIHAIGNRRKLAHLH